MNKKRRGFNRQCRNTKDHKRLLKGNIHWQHGQPRRKGQILRKD